jgi:hypothetical protein
MPQAIDDDDQSKPITPRPIEKPDYEKIRSKVVKQFKKTLAYLANN